MYFHPSSFRLRPSIPMFERRLKIVLVFMFVTAFVLVARSMHVQVVQRSRWNKLAADAMVLPRLLETTRGKILDRQGRVIAQDEGCIDACVDFRVLRSEPDPVWLRKYAIKRLQERQGEAYKLARGSEREAMRQKEITLVKEQIRTMWAELAQITGKPEEEITRTRSEIEERVAFRKRYVWWRRYEIAMNRHEGEEKPSWYKSFLVGENSDAPRLDVFEQEIAEESAKHVIVRAIDPAAYNKLAKDLDRFPGLELRGSNHRIYPYGSIASHVIGYLGKISKEDLDKQTEDNSVEERDRRSYQLNDLIGRNGLEAMLEPTLRGTRGKELYNPGTDQIVKSWPVIPGQDVKCTIDIELQDSIQQLFQNAKVPGPERLDPPLTVEMHGAAVVLDISTNEVLALVSNPTYDLNLLDQNASKLARDVFNTPLFNRATQAQREPGSTIKPVVGIAAVSSGVLKLHEGIECLGTPILNDRPSPYNKCWTVSKVEPGSPEAIHHRIPSAAPHHGRYGCPDGTLVLSDALCRSCNVFFVTCAHDLGVGRLSDWMNRFGLGRPTGIGITESRGKLPISYDGSNVEMTTCSAGIGQGFVSASPLQMANVAATIGRGGIWLRPKLVDDGVKLTRWLPPKADAAWSNVPNRLDLKIDPALIAEVREGMTMVTNDHAGTGTQLNSAEVHGLMVAGKTGTAQAAPFVIKGIDESGNRVLDENGEPKFYRPQASLYGNENPRLPWYRAYNEGKSLNHAWFIGFAPADHPRIAFAVMVEYGGSGGAVAGPIAAGILDALRNHGYLPDQTAALQK